jgi:hypothetical protein
MDDILFISTITIFSCFTMIYGNLALDVIGTKNIKYVENNPIIIYLAIFFYVVFLVTTVYKEEIPNKLTEISLLSILLFLIVIFIVSSHPIFALTSILLILLAYIYYIQKSSKKVADYI